MGNSNKHMCGVQGVILSAHLRSTTQTALCRRVKSTFLNLQAEVDAESAKTALLEFPWTEGVKELIGVRL